jgi:hypothetical protein
MPAATLSQITTTPFDRRYPKSVKNSMQIIVRPGLLNGKVSIRTAQSQPGCGGGDSGSGEGGDSGPMAAEVAMAAVMVADGGGGGNGDDGVVLLVVLLVVMG